MAELQQNLTTLLGGGGARGVEMRLVKKNGRPLLLLPGNFRAAALALALYPAQTMRARLARRGLGAALSAGLSPGTEKFSVSISATNPLVRFLAESVGRRPEAGVPIFGVLAGNPNTAGQRFIFLVFDEKGKPAVVVKAGVTGEAKKLIEQERDFLAKAPRVAGIPRLKGDFKSPEAEALAVDFVEGEPPGGGDEGGMAEVLNKWVLSEKKITILQTRVWRDLEKACPTNPLWEKLREKLKGKTIRPAIFHGDFAPWNIKITPAGKWAVFDWERGDLSGLPGYDWFHYLIQTGILVAHKPEAALIERLEELFRSAEFQMYAAHAQITGSERELAALYLLHLTEVIRPAEGREESSRLLAALASL